MTSAWLDYEGENTETIKQVSVQHTSQKQGSYQFYDMIIEDNPEFYVKNGNQVTELDFYDISYLTHHYLITNPNTKNSKQVASKFLDWLIGRLIQHNLCAEPTPILKDKIGTKAYIHLYTYLLNSLSKNPEALSDLFKSNGLPEIISFVLTAIEKIALAERANSRRMAIVSGSPTKKTTRGDFNDIEALADELEKCEDDETRSQHIRALAGAIMINPLIPILKSIKQWAKDLQTNIDTTTSTYGHNESQLTTQMSHFTETTQNENPIKKSILSLAKALHDVQPRNWIEIYSYIESALEKTNKKVEEITKKNEDPQSEIQNPIYPYSKLLASDTTIKTQVIDLLRLINLVVRALLVDELKIIVQDAFSLIMDNTQQLIAAQQDTPKLGTKHSDFTPVQMFVFTKTVLGKRWVVDSLHKLLCTLGAETTKEWHQQTKLLIQHPQANEQVIQSAIEWFDRWIQKSLELPSTLSKTEHIQQTAKILSNNYGDTQILDLSWEEALFTLRYILQSNLIHQVADHLKIALPLISQEKVIPEVVGIVLGGEVTDSLLERWHTHHLTDEDRHAIDSITNIIKRQINKQIQDVHGLALKKNIPIATQHATNIILSSPVLFRFWMLATHIFACMGLMAASIWIKKYRSGLSSLFQAGTKSIRKLIALAVFDWVSLTKVHLQLILCLLNNVRKVLGAKKSALACLATVAVASALYAIHHLGLYTLRASYWLLLTMVKSPGTTLAFILGTSTAIVVTRNQALLLTRIKSGFLKVKIGSIASGSIQSEQNQSAKQSTPEGRSWAQFLGLQALYETPKVKQN